MMLWWLPSRKKLLQGSQLRKDLTIREPIDLNDALHRASRYAFFEDEDAKMAVRLQPAKAKEKTRDIYQEPRQYYDPKAAKRGTIFAAMDSEDRTQAPVKPLSSKNSYCRFHEFGGHSPEECKHLLNILLGKYKSGEVKAIYHPKGGRSKRKVGFKQAQGELEDEDQHPPKNHRPFQNREKEVCVPENKLPRP